MKSILLTTTAIVAFAGAAYADGHTGVSFSADVTLGYNDNDDSVDDNEYGFFYDGDLDVAMAAELDNGVTAGAEFELEFVDEDGSSSDLGQDIISGSFVLSLETDGAGLYFGDTAFAAETYWASAGDMEADGFSEADGEAVLRGEASFGDITAGVSVAVGDADGDSLQASDDEAYTQLSFGAAADLGGFSVTVAYQEESDSTLDLNAANGDFNNNAIFGVSAATTLSGFDVAVAYATDTTAEESSIGVSAGTSFGPISVSGYYSVEDDATGEDNYGIDVGYADGPIAVAVSYDYEQDAPDWDVEGSFETAFGVTLVGVIENHNEGDEPDFFFGGTYDLGGGASLLVGYGQDDDDSTGDEIGSDEYMDGITTSVSFSF